MTDPSERLRVRLGAIFAARERVRVATTIGGGDGAAFARSHHAEAELPVDRLRAATVERHLADLVARALDEDRPETP